MDEHSVALFIPREWPPLTGSLELSFSVPNGVSPFSNTLSSVHSGTSAAGPCSDGLEETETGGGKGERRGREQRVRKWA